MLYAVDSDNKANSALFNCCQFQLLHIHLDTGVSNLQSAGTCGPEEFLKNCYVILIANVCILSEFGRNSNHLISVCMF